MILRRVIALQKPIYVPISSSDVAVQACGNKYMCSSHLKPIKYTTYINLRETSCKAILKCSVAQKQGSGEFSAAGRRPRRPAH